MASNFQCAQTLVNSREEWSYCFCFLLLLTETEEYCKESQRHYSDSVVEIGLWCACVGMGVPIIPPTFCEVVTHKTMPVATVVSVLAPLEAIS